MILATRETIKLLINVHARPLYSMVTTQQIIHNKLTEINKVYKRVLLHVKRTGHPAAARPVVRDHVIGI